MAVLTAAACSDASGASQPDGQSLASAFGEVSRTLYEEAGIDRGESTYVELDDNCFAVDRPGVTAIVDAVGLDSDSTEIGLGTFLRTDSDAEETLFCAIGTGEDSASISLTVGTVPYDRDGLLTYARATSEENGLSLEEIEGDASGLNEDDALGLTQADGRLLTFAWVSDGFRVQLGFTSVLAGPEAGMPALSAAVDAVEAALT